MTSVLFRVDELSKMETLFHASLKKLAIDLLVDLNGFLIRKHVILKAAA